MTCKQIDQIRNPSYQLRLVDSFLQDTDDLSSEELTKIVALRCAIKKQVDSEVNKKIAIA